MKNRIEVFAGCVLVASIPALLALLPDFPWRHAGEPPYIAVAYYFITLAVVGARRARNPRGTRLERIWMAVFLAGMPGIYVSMALLQGAPRAALLPELAGVVIFGTLAVLGVVRSPMFLAAGIAGHGLLWDAWHFGRTDFTPDWYAAGCALVDLALAFWVATQTYDDVAPRLT